MSAAAEAAGAWGRKGVSHVSNRIKSYINLKNLIFFLSIFMFAWLAWYFYTGFGGPMELAA